MQRLRIISLTAALAVCWFAGLGVTSSLEAADAAYTLVPDAHGMVLNSPEGRVVFRYMTKKPEKTNLAANSVCCFHPLCTPSGERVTALAPGDHHHHRGVFLAWHTLEFWQKADFSKLGPTAPPHGWDITRGDFWGWGQYAPTEGRVIENREVKLLGADSKHAKVEIRNAWIANARTMMDEVLTARVGRHKGVYVIDLDYRLTPRADLELNRNAFGGFCVRFRNDGDCYYADPQGKVTLPDPHYSAPDLNWPAADWYDYTIKLSGGKTVGLATYSHGDNPPTTWHNPRYVWMVNPCITAAKAFEVPAGETLRLRYRLVVHDGPTPTELLNQLTN